MPPLGYVSSTGAAGAYESAPDPDTTADDNDDNGTFAMGVIRSAPVTLSPGAEPTGEADTGGLSASADDAGANLTVDFGLFQPMSIGNSVWLDADNNGMFDAAESGMAGVRVQLFDATTMMEVPVGPDGVYGTTDDATGGVATDADGRYLFSNLVAGTYYVEIGATNFAVGGALEGYTTSTGTNGSATGPVEPAASPYSDSDNVDKGTLTGSVVRSATVTLAVDTEPTGETPDNDTRTPDANENLTVDFGFFRPAAIQGQTWVDANRDGQRGAGEQPQAALTVTLYDATNAVVATATTAADGSYLFANLLPGDYRIVVSDVPAGFVLTSQDQGADTTDSDVNSISGSVTITALVAGEVRTNIDAGIYNDTRGTVGDFVWYDRNEDGVQDAGEPGIAGVTVELYRAGDATPLATTLTDADGAYQFANLLANTYIVKVVPPANYAITVQNAGGTSSDSDVDAQGESASIVLTAGATNQTIDAGLYYTKVSLGNLIWNDVNNNGLRDAGEPGLPNVTVTLYRDSDGNGVPDGAAIATTTTNANGNYRFVELDPGTYLVEVSAPAGYISSTGANGQPAGIYEPSTGADGTDNDDNGTRTGGVVRSAPVTLTRNGEPTGEPGTVPGYDMTPDADSDLTIDFGFFQPLRLTSTVWHDRNGDGLLNATEPPLSGWVVVLYNATTNLMVATTTTDAQGVYDFTGLTPGDYYVTVASQGTFVSTIDVFNGTDANDDIDGDDNGTMMAETTTWSKVISLAVGSEPGDDPDQPAGNSNANTTLDLGFYQPMSIGNIIWRDANNNGQRDASEQGIAGVQVELYRDEDGDGLPEAGEYVTVTTTDGVGNYLFAALRPGAYIVVVPASNSAPNAPLFGLASSTGGGSEPASAPGGVNDDDNGTTQADGSVSSGVVTLISGGAPVTDSDSNANTDLSIDFGFYPLATLGNYVWLDSDRDGVQDAGENGLPGVTVKLYDAGADGIAGTVDDIERASTTTDANGGYEFTNLVPGAYFVSFNRPEGYTFSPTTGGDEATDSDASPVTGNSQVVTLAPGQSNTDIDAGLFFSASLGDRVWLDANANGIQDAGEEGIGGITVRLVNTGNGMIVATTTTDEQGNYAFVSVPPGSYQVEVVIPGQYRVSPVNQGTNDAADSDIAPATGRTGTITIVPDQPDPTIDAGLYTPVALGNQVWKDTNNNGVQDGDEPGLAGVTVELYQDTNGDGALAPGERVATRVTDSSGAYLFTDLVPGSYQVVIPASNFATGGPLQGYSTSTGAITTNQNPTGPYEPAPSPDTDIDEDDNGTFVEGLGVVSAPVTLESGREPFDRDENTNTNLGVDFGFLRPAALGSIVWDDLNQNGVRDANEPGIEGVRVTLYDATGAVVAQTVTGPGGGFLFGNLVAGAYQIGFDRLPTGYNFTTPGVSGSGATSDANPLTGRTQVIAINEGQTDQTLSAGLVKAPTAISLVSFTAAHTRNGVVVRWITGVEIDTQHFYIVRSATGQLADAVRVSEDIAATGRGAGASYNWTDMQVTDHTTYTYWLVEVEASGVEHTYGPAQARSKTAATNQIFMPFITR